MSNARSYQPLLIADVVTNPSSPGVVAVSTLAAQVLPDGCQVFALSNRTLYQLDKTSGDDAEGGAAGGLIAARGGGMWVPQNTSQGSVGLVNFGDLSVSYNGITSFNGITGTYATQHNGAEWEVDTASGQMTWVGPSNQKFLYNVNASLYTGTTVNQTALGVSIDAAQPPASRESRATSPVATGAAAVYKNGLTGILELDQDQTVRVLGAGTTGSGTIPYFQFTLVPLS